MAPRTYRTIVAGAGSALGGRLALRLAQAGHGVTALEAPEALEAPGGRARARFEAAREAGARVLSLDVAEAGALDPLLEGTDFVFLASLPREGDRSWKGAWRSVTLSAAHVADSVARAGSGVRRLVAFSSAFVAGAGRPDGTPADEDDPPRPRTFLARALALREHVLRQRCPAAGVRYAILRPGLLVGGDDGLPPASLPGLDALPFVPVPGGAPVPLPLVHLDDACDAALHLARYPSGQDGTFFLADGADHHAADLLAAAARARGRPALPLPGVPAAWLGRALRAASGAEDAWHSRRGGHPRLDPDLADALAAGLRVSTARIAAAGFTPSRPDALA